MLNYGLLLGLLAIFVIGVIGYFVDKNRDKIKDGDEGNVTSNDNIFDTDSNKGSSEEILKKEKFVDIIIVNNSSVVSPCGTYMNINIDLANGNTLHEVIETSDISIGEYFSRVVIDKDETKTISLNVTFTGDLKYNDRIDGNIILTNREDEREIIQNVDIELYDDINEIVIPYVHDYKIGR